MIDEESSARCAWINLLLSYDPETREQCALQMIIDMMDIFNQTEFGRALNRTYEDMRRKAVVR